MLGSRLPLEELALPCPLPFLEQPRGETEELEQLQRVNQPAPASKGISSPTPFAVRSKQPLLKKASELKYHCYFNHSQTRLGILTTEMPACLAAMATDFLKLFSLIIKNAWCFKNDFILTLFHPPL